MKNYKITTQEVGDYPIEEYGDAKTVIVEAENTEDLIEKMGWNNVDESHERYEWSCEVLINCIENGRTCFFRHDEDYFDDELYIWQGENADGNRINVEVVSDKEAKKVIKKSKDWEKIEEKNNLDRLNANSDEWDQFFMGKMPNEMMEELKKYKFPELI